jgi:hypothetical protein
MVFALNASAVQRRRRILSRVGIKPFNTNYRIPIAHGYVVLNGDQVTRIEVIEQVDGFGLSLKPQSWTVIFYLADGHKHEIRPSEWTRKFVQEVFSANP